MKPASPFVPLLIAAIIASGCGEGPSIDLTSMDESPSQAQQTTRRVACDQAPDGTPCGQDHHCMLNACTKNACGDGVMAGAEACDDGNERDNDGCDMRCHVEVPPGCGNASVEPGEECDDGKGAASLSCNIVCKKIRCGDGITSAGEECDDGNTIDTDRCTNRCATVVAVCGNGVRELLEECDDGNLVAGDECTADCTLPSASEEPVDGGLDGGDSGDPDQNSAADAGSHDGHDAGSEIDAGPRPPLGWAQAKPACAACRAGDGVCNNFFGLLDLVALCLHNADPDFVQKCVDAIDCAYENDCGYNAQGLNQCFCGTADVSACQTAGQANGPCMDEIYAAAHTTALPVLIGSFTDVSLPIGIATYLIQCDYEGCPSCLP